MNSTLASSKVLTEVWDDERVKALLYFPRFPIRLIQEEPWQSWIGQRGGLKAVHAYLQNYPFSPSHLRILDVVLSNPEAVAEVYANRLNISRATYFYQLRELIPALVQALNCWEIQPISPPKVRPESVPELQPSLPVPLTNLVGVKSILQSLYQLFSQESVRLLTLLGPGGIGKTRLSIELAHILEGQFGNQICFVDLSTVQDHTQIAETISQALGLEAPGSPQLKDFLRPHQFLLIIDNFEHVLPGRELVTELLVTAPRLKILITSRVALHIYGAHEFTVPPLAMPVVACVKDPEPWIQSPVVRLFVQRAQSVNPGFVLNRQNLEAVSELCLRMEGIPLAIELAAFQVKYFSPQAMLVRLANDRCLDFLSKTPKRLSHHQQTMRAMLDWSYNLLRPDLQSFFSSLAVFPDGFTISAVEVIYAKIDQNFDVQAGLTALSEQSLLEQSIEPDGEPRFHMLSIIREYTLEKLEQRGITSDLRRSFANYYLKLAEGCTHRGNSPSYKNGYARLQREYTNLKTAVQWTIDHHEEDLSLRFIVALWDFWKCSGNLREGAQFTQMVLEQTAQSRLPIRVEVLRLAGWLAHDVRDFTTMLWAFQKSIDLSETLDDQPGVGLALQGLGELAQLRGQPQQALEHIERSLKIFRETKDQKQIAWSLDLLGRIKFSLGKLPVAQNYFEQSLKIFREIGSNSGLTLSLVHLGQSFFYQGFIKQAAALFDECLRLNRTIGKINSSAFTLALNYLGEIAFYDSQIESARELNSQSLRLSKQAGYAWCTELAQFTRGLIFSSAGELDSAAFCIQESLFLQQSLMEGWRALTLLEASAELLVARQDWLGATRLFGVAESLRKFLGIEQIPLYQEKWDSSLQILEDKIDAETRIEAWVAGQALTFEQALAYALRCLE